MSIIGVVREKLFASVLRAWIAIPGAFRDQEWVWSEVKRWVMVSTPMRLPSAFVPAAIMPGALAQLGRMNAADDGQEIRHVPRENLSITTGANLRTTPRY